MQKASLSSKTRVQPKSKSKTAEYLENTKLTQKSYHNFINSLNSDVTKRKYHLTLVQFLSNHKFSIERTNQFLKTPVKEIEG